MAEYPSTKQEAREIGAEYYFTGKPCKHGHIALRSMRRGGCVECIKEQDRNPAKKEKNRKWKQENRDRQKEYNQKYKKRIHQAEEGHDAEIRRRYNAAKYLFRAIEAGEVVKPDICSNCEQTGDIQGHHWDYDRPLDVVWLCRQCHADIHNKEEVDGNE